MGGIVLIGHGRFAEGLKEAVEMLCGECPQLFTACLDSSDGPESFAVKFQQAYESAAQYGNVTVFCDLVGGTPCNVAVQSLFEKQETKVIAGANAAMLMTYILESQDVEVSMEEGRNAIVDVMAALESDSVECDE